MMKKFLKEWEEVRLEKVSELFFSNVDKKIDPQEIPVRLCNYMDVYSNLYITNDIPFMRGSVKKREIEKYSLYKDDVIITKDSETPDDIANAAVVSEDLDNTVCGYHLAVIRPNKNKIDGIFLMHYLHYPTVNNQFAKLANGVTRFGLTTNSIKQAKIFLPPLAEQHRIAEILSTWDEAISLTERLIVAKQTRKKGLMQQLLMGKTRFGEFEGEWDEVRLEKIASVERGKFSARPRNNPQLYGGKIPFVQTGDVTASSGWLKSYSQTLNEKGLEVSRQFPRGTILVTIAANIGDIALTTFDVACPDSLVAVQAKDGISNKWLMYTLKMKKQELESLSTQNAQRNINLQVLRPLKIVLPTLKEQRRIAAVLQTCDAELELLRRKLSALQTQKRGLMQQLLTGRVRVNPSTSP